MYLKASTKRCTRVITSWSHFSFLSQDFIVHSTKNSNIFYLSPNKQKEIELDFVKGVPWNSFGRKNVGFLYAIMHGAATIFDFDDDNYVSSQSISS